MTEDPTDQAGIEGAAASVTPTHLLFALIGFALHLFVGIFIFFSTLIAPLWAVAAMGVVWLIAAGVAVARWRSRSWLPLILAVVTSMVWILVVNLGDVLLGWTA